MKEPTMGGPSENHPEWKKEIELKVGFLFRCNSIPELLAGLENLSEQDNIRSLMLTEFSLDTSDVIASLQEISQAAQNKAVDIIMAPNERNSGVPWKVREKELKGKGVLVSGTYKTDAEPESIGFYFDKNGSIYAFPKNWDTPIHPIPNTRVAVSVCGEIAYMRPEDLRDVDVDVIYNPSREGDDPYVKYRMMGLANPNITKEEISAMLLRDDPSYRSYKDVPDPGAKQRFIDANPDYADTWEENEAAFLAENPPEIKKQKAEELLESIYSIAHGKSKDSSLYVRDVDEKLSEKGIIVVRCDHPETSGVLNPHEDVSLKADYRGSEAVMDITFTKAG